MIKRVCLLIGLFFLLQCSQKEVLLPVIEAEGISEIQNHSSIWIFYDPTGQDSKAQLNKNNKLLNTHWIFNIDRRLTMGDVIPLLQDMQENRNKDSMHKKEGMENYFSYADSESERIALLPFPEINFKVIDEFTAFREFNQDSCTLVLRIQEDELQLKGKSFSAKELNLVLGKQDLCPDKENLTIRLLYDESLSYQNYLETKAQLAVIPLSLDTIELVETLK